MADLSVVPAGWARLLDLDIASETVQRMSARSQLRRFADGETMIGQEDAATDVLLMLSGSARVERLTENGHHIWLSDLPAGNLVGDMAQLIGTARTSAVVASGPVSAARMDGRVFEQFLKEDVIVAYAMTRLLARRLKSASDLLVDQISMDVQGRLYALLVRLGRPVEGDSEALEIRPDPMVNDLAERIHATREATSRALRVLRERGLVIQNGDHWKIIQPAWAR